MLEKACKTDQMHTSVAGLHENWKAQMCLFNKARLHRFSTCGSGNSGDKTDTLRLMMSLGRSE